MTRSKTEPGDDAIAKAVTLGDGTVSAPEGRSTVTGAPLTSKPKLTCTESHAIQPSALEYVAGLESEIERLTRQRDFQEREAIEKGADVVHYFGVLKRIATAGEIHDPHWAGNLAREALRGADSTLVSTTRNADETTGGHSHTRDDAVGGYNHTSPIYPNIPPEAMCMSHGKDCCPWSGDWHETLCPMCKGPVEQADGDPGTRRRPDKTTPALCNAHNYNGDGCGLPEGHDGPHAI